MVFTLCRCFSCRKTNTGTKQTQYRYKTDKLSCICLICSSLNHLVIIKLTYEILNVFSLSSDPVKAMQLHCFFAV